VPAGRRRPGPRVPLVRRGRALCPGGLGGSVARWSYPRRPACRTDRLFSARRGW
jgi:hypothetical protein